MLGPKMVASIDVGTTKVCTVLARLEWTEQLEIPEIRLAGVGRKDGGIGLARLVLEVTESVVGAVLKQRGTFSPRIGSGSTREKLEDAGKKLLEGLDPFKKRK